MTLLPAKYDFETPVFVYGPPGSGKSSLGQALAEALCLPFTDLDTLIARRAGVSIPEIFSGQGEAVFRAMEREALAEMLAVRPGVVALGGGTLLDPANRTRVEASGPVIFLDAELETLQARLGASAEQRPLLSGDLAVRLPELLARRSAHYASFPLRIETGSRAPDALAWEAQVRLGRFFVRGMGQGYPVRVQYGGLAQLGEALQATGLRGPVAVVSDENVGRLYAGRVLASLQRCGYPVQVHFLQPGEEHKTLAAVTGLWELFLADGLERGSTVVALGGGVTGDLAGFAAAAYLRGIAWVVAPTSLLAMVDASLGGKTGADLPQGKNLVGAFHPPRLVLADPQVLESLPAAELRSGLAEVVKHGVIGDPELFALCERGWSAVTADWEAIVRRAMAVKIRVIQEDPFEAGQRAALNLGHTVGHGLEKASGFRLRHGEAVAIGMVIAAQLAEAQGLAEQGLAGRIEAALQGLGLPTRIPEDMDRQAVLAAMRIDKKRKEGSLHFALPVRIGEVRVGVAVDDLGFLD